MLDIRLFRFDSNIDFTSYYKPYFYENFDFNTLRALLNDIKSDDPYFEFDGVKFCKINDVVVSLDEKFDVILQNFGECLKIEPLSTYYAYKDLKFSTEEFDKKFEIFSAFNYEKSYYDTLISLFYASDMQKYADDFFGLSGFVFVKYLLEKFPSKKDEILNIVKAQMPYFTHPNFLNEPFKMEKTYDFLCRFLAFRPYKYKKISQIPADFTPKHNFKDFNVAVYGDDLSNFLKIFALKNVKFDAQNSPSGAQIFNVNKEIAIKLASKVLFDAFDSGTDFLLVNDERDFEIFDGCSKDIKRFSNRDLPNFYVLKFDEFLALASGEKPASLENHKLKVTLI